MRRYLIGALLLGACSGTTPSISVSPNNAGNARSPRVAPALDAITQADLRRDMFAMASDAMRGREAGTLDEMRATGWVAERARDAGLQPAGDDGTFFQWWPMRRTRLSENSEISIGGRKLQLWKDAVVLSTQMANVDLPIVYVADTAALSSADVRGKAVAMVLSSIVTQPLAEFTIRGNFQATTSQMVRQHAAAIERAGAAAAILLSNGDANEEEAWNATGVVTSRGSYAIDSAGEPA